MSARGIELTVVILMQHYQVVRDGGGWAMAVRDDDGERDETPAMRRRRRFDEYLSALDGFLDAISDEESGLRASCHI